MDNKKLHALVTDMLAGTKSVREAVAEFAPTISEEELDLEKGPADSKSVNPDGKEPKKPDTLKDQGSKEGTDKTIPVKQESLDLDKGPGDSKSTNPDGKEPKKPGEVDDQATDNEKKTIGDPEADSPGSLEKGLGKTESRWQSRMRRIMEARKKKPSISKKDVRK